MKDKVAYPDYDWRADDFNLIRGDYYLSVSRAWCAEGERLRAWRWSAYVIDGKNGGVDDALGEESNDAVAERHGLTIEDAKAAALAWLDRRLAEDATRVPANVYSFAGLEPAPEEPIAGPVIAPEPPVEIWF